MKLDDASWHFSSPDFPKDMAAKAGATHIGMFFAWATLNDMLSDELKADLEDELKDIFQKNDNAWRLRMAIFRREPLRI